MCLRQLRTGGGQASERQVQLVCLCGSAIIQDYFSTEVLLRQTWTCACFWAVLLQCGFGVYWRADRIHDKGGTRVSVQETALYGDLVLALRDYAAGRLAPLGFGGNVDDARARLDEFIAWPCIAPCCAEISRALRRPVASCATARSLPADWPGRGGLARGGAAPA